MINLHISTANLAKEFDIALGDILDAVDQNLEAVAELVYQEAKTTTAFRDKTGNLRRAIRLRKSKYQDRGYIVIATGRNKEEGGAGYHAHLVEFGHVMLAWGRVTKKNGGRVDKHPFMRPAKEKGIRKAIELFKQK